MIGLVNGNAKWLPFADNTFHCGVTSPPYWSLRDYSVPGQLGLEPTPEEYVANMVAVFREVRRVLRDDGVLWLNIGDSYASETKGTGGPTPKQASNPGSFYDVRRLDHGLKNLDLVGIPWRLAMALQADGWYLRSDVIWSKPNPMPESVNGWRWERHKVKISNGRTRPTNSQQILDAMNGTDNMRSVPVSNQPLAEYTDCPGCPTCAPNDGLVLRRGAWRPTKAHEYVFLLTKSDRYFCDAEAVREAQTGYFTEDGNNPMVAYKMIGTKPGIDGSSNDERMSQHRSHREIPGGRNRRTVWQIATQPYSGAHFATFPEALVEPCVKAATSERGCCPVCGSQWARVVEDTYQLPETRKSSPDIDRQRYSESQKTMVGYRPDEVLSKVSSTLGFRRTCEHDAPPVPCTVFDPFAGTGTVGVVAQKLGHSFVGLELSMEYIDLAKERIAKSNGYHVGRLL